MTPYSLLRIGGLAMAAAVFCLLILFLYATPLDPIIQAMTLVFYLAATLAMGAVLRHHFVERLAGGEKKHEADTPEAAGETVTALIETDPETPQPVPEAEPRIRQGTSVVLLTRDPLTARVVRNSLSGWRQDIEIASSCAEASQRILNLVPDGNDATRITLIVDSQGLELDLIHLPDLIRQEAELVKLRMICILSDRETARSEPLLDAGYHAFLTKPIDKAQLFAALTSEQAQAVSAPNVVNLAQYRKRQGHQVRKHILLADHHTQDRKRIAALLKQAGHRVKPVENGEQALDALERQRFDVALINLHLPIMNGTQVIKLHRFTTPHPEWASFIIMTDQTTPATLRLCRELQIRACLFKPVPTDSLLQMIDDAPVISPPVPATIERVESRRTATTETEFLHADLLDTKVLQALDQLDSESGFVLDLIAIFDRDSIVILQGMEEAVECLDSKRFVELSSILMDNAGQLGAFALYETCLTLQQMRQHKLNTTLTGKLEHLQELVYRTKQAFQHYLSEREKQHSDRS